MEELKKRGDLLISEIGEIFFFYRPKIDVEQPHSAADLQRLYMVLRPVSSEKDVELKQDPHSEGVKESPRGDKEKIDGKREVEEIKSSIKVKGEQDDKQGEKTAGELREEIKQDEKGEQGMNEVDLTRQKLMRLIVVGRKVLPDPSSKGRPAWSYVELVSTSSEAMKDSLGAHGYETKTRGHREQPGARPAGEGLYCILKHKDHTHLVYKLDNPKEHNALQDELNLEKEASFIISIKNPDAGTQRNAGLVNKRKGMYPAKIQALMGSYRFVPAHPPDYLNYEGCEFILIPASDDIDKELGLQLEPEQCDAALCAELAKMVDMESEVVRKPLFHGEWA